MKVPRVKNLTEEAFINDYLIANKPVIIVDGMKDWNVKRFSPENLKNEFGEHYVQVYNDLFDLQNVVTLKTYIDDNFNRTPEQGLTKEYTRWYTKLKEVDFYWSDEVFSKLTESWDHPYFLPKNNLAVPYCCINGTKNVSEDSFPYKGLFISGKGSRTRLHKDPFTSNAVLCQFYGEKEFYLYDPKKEAYVMKNKEFVDVKNVDTAKFPEFSTIEADYKDVLSPGEMILFPSGWFHDVTCISDSVSITWNFLHNRELENLFTHMKNNPEDDQLEILKYFLRNNISENAEGNEIENFYKSEIL